MLLYDGLLFISISTRTLPDFLLSLLLVPPLRHTDSEGLIFPMNAAAKKKRVKSFTAC